YRATGDPAELDKGIAWQEKAFDLDRRNSISLGNLAYSIQGRALAETARPAMDLSLLRRTGGWELLPFLYLGNDGWTEVRERLTSKHDSETARRNFEQLQLLGPKRPDAYSALTSLYMHARQLEPLQRLSKTLETIDLDQADSNKRTLEELEGKYDDRRRK